MNDAACDFLGYSRKELLSKTVSDLCPDFPPEKWAAHWEELKAAGALTFESHDLTKDGRLIPVEISSNYLEFGGKEYSFTFVRDITERKRAEEETHAANARFQGILDTASDAILSMGGDQRIVLFNQQAEAMFGYPAHEVIGRPLKILLPPRFRKGHKGHVEGFAAGSVSRRPMSERTELYGLRKDGKEFPVEITISKLELEGQPVFTAVVREITERKRLEDQLRQSQKLEALGQLASGVAHNFNNSLAVILGRTELSELLTENPKVRRNLEIIEKAAHDGTNTVRRLQDFARKREGRPRETVRLNDIVSDVIEMLRPRWKDEAELVSVRFEVGFNARAEKDAVRGEGSALREALINLVHNALDAMPEGGRLAVATENAADDVIVSVTDSGIGMDAETRERALEPFFTTKGERGTGLGLSMVYGIVQRHGGQIEIESAPGKGTTVRLTLPTADEPARNLSQPKLTPSASRRILIIEDEKEVAEIIADMLNEGGHTAEFATDPRDGLDRFKKANFDIVMTDLSMPEMPGWLVAEEIRRMNPSVPVIMLTGWGAQLDPEQLKASHVDCVLSKPINRADILNSVDKAFAD